MHVHPIHDPIAKSLGGKSSDIYGEKGGYEPSDTAESGRQLNAEGFEIPTEEELLTLRRVADSMPLAAMLIVLVEFAERFSYYGE